MKKIFKIIIILLFALAPIGVYGVVQNYDIIVTSDGILIQEGGDILFDNVALIDADSTELYIKPDGLSKNLLLGWATQSWNGILMYSDYLSVACGSDIILSTSNNKDSQIIISLPTSPNGELKIKGSLWYNKITKTLKFEPINKITCGGFDK